MGILKWLSSAIDRMTVWFHNHEARLAAIEQHLGLKAESPTISHDEKPAEPATNASPSPGPQTTEAVQPGGAAAVITTKEPDPAPAAPAAPAFDSATQIRTRFGVKRFTEYPTFADYARLVMDVGFPLDAAQKQAWMVATGNGDPDTHTAGGEDITKIPQGGARTWHPGDTITAFYGADGSGLRNEFEPGVPQRITIVCPPLGDDATGFEFKWGDNPGSKPSTVSCHIEDAQGNVIVADKPENEREFVKDGRRVVDPAHAGATYVAVIALSEGGSADLCIYPIKS